MTKVSKKVLTAEKEDKKGMSLQSLELEMNIILADSGFDDLTIERGSKFRINRIVRILMGR